MHYARKKRQKPLDLPEVLDPKQVAQYLRVQRLFTPKLMKGPWNDFPKILYCRGKYFMLMDVERYVTESAEKGLRMNEKGEWHYVGSRSIDETIIIQDTPRHKGNLALLRERVRENRKTFERIIGYSGDLQGHDEEDLPNGEGL